MSIDTAKPQLDCKPDWRSQGGNPVRQKRAQVV
jgi:hypothetical protein